MKTKLLFLLWWLYTANGISIAQIINKDVFLQGKYIELAMNECGAFGTNGRKAPLNYNPNAFGGALGFVADKDKDGWNSGTPNRCGDYFVFGLPYEGWYLQVGNKIYENGDGCSSGNNNIFTETRLFNYRKDSIVAAEWEGIKDSIYLRKKVYFKHDALYFIVEVEIENRRKTQLKDIFYMRTVDADNEAVTTNDPETINTIVYQPRFGDSRSLVRAVGKLYGCYLGLGTKDCRAQSSTGIVPNREPKNAWSGLPSRRRTSGSETSDTEICISYKLQNLKPGGKATLSYAYVLEESLLDEALDLVEPKLLADGIDISIKREATTCINSPLTLEIQNEGNYTWNWSPNVDIDTTRGRKVVITPTQQRTYTLRGFACDTVEVEFLVKVRQDTANPTIRCPNDTVVYLPANACSVAVQYPNPDFWDDCTGESITRKGNPSGAFFSRGSHTISYTIKDKSGKSDSCAFKINVLDTIKPKTACKDLVFYQKRGSCLTKVDYPLNFATDNCPNLIYELTSGIGSGGQFPVGQTQELYSVKDSSGNSTSCSFTLEVIDTLPPVIELPARVIGRAGAPVFYTVKAFDECDSLIAVSQLEGKPSGAIYDTAGVYIQKFTAVDKYGNRSTKSFEIVINTPPKINDQTFSIPENSAIGTIVGKIQAEDADGNDIVYKILSGNKDNAFRLNVISGILTVFNDRPLDYESNPVFELMVEVIDDGPGNLRDTALITVLVLNLNEPPSAIELSNRFISENQDIGIIIGSLYTVDEDSFDVYENYTFIETAVFRDNSYFFIEDKNKLAAAISFNYEAQKEYVIKIQSQEKNNSDVISDTFKIIILDVNDIPQVSDFSKVTNANRPVSLSRLDFDKDYFDEDGDLLNSIVIAKLPEHGKLSLNGQFVSQGDSIFPFLLSQLVYSPDLDYQGEDEFIWQASDNRSLSELRRGFIKINPPLQAQAGENQQICLGERALLGAKPTAAGGTPPYSYVWRPRIELSSDSEPNPTAAPLTHTRYVITITDSIGSVARDTADIEVSQFPDVFLAKNEWSVLDGEKIFISIIAKDSSLSAQWLPNEGVEDPTALSTFISPQLQDPTQAQIINYTVKIQNPQGCETELSLKLEVLPKVNIPTGFSPNGDGINDTWILRGIEAYPDARIEIFDRYGQRVFVQTGYNRQNAWDGRLNGKLLPFGSYFFVVELGKLSLRYSGSITILE